MKKKKTKVSDIQSVIMLALSLMTVTTSIFIGLLLYNRYETEMRHNDVSNTQNMMESIVSSTEQYLKSMRQLANTINYNIIQVYDVSNPEFNQQLNLIYEADKDKIQSIALYDMEGELIAAEPVTLQKEGIGVTGQPWFVNAAEKVANMHFSTPHIQNLFRYDAKRYYRVISLSQAVDFISGDRPENGILLVDMKYSFIEKLFSRINYKSREHYYYICDGEGKLIYHPYANEISNGMFSENVGISCSSEDGIYRNQLSPSGEKWTIIVNTISYTGWKLVGVVLQDVRTDSVKQFRMYMVIIVIMLIMMLLVVNRIVSRKISSPIIKLDASVTAYEAGEKPDIYIGGSYEIRHLGNSVQKSYEEIEHLMTEIVAQQNKRRRSELVALQSQINPHFLYNTLESITWMIEGNKNKDAVFMISELAKIFRISLSNGKTIISIEDELKHCKNYMNIQKYRYKERFVTEYDVSEEIHQFCTVKLIIQPILENAIYYGVGNMDADDNPRILVKGWRTDNDIYLAVSDNGMGMRQEDVKNILSDNKKVPKHGSGVGLINVHTRIQLMFSAKYGLIVESEPDEGTTVTIHLPAIPYTEENCELLENGVKKPGNEGDDEKT
jgi:two-component system sensor histidine kinase YesM